jgi:transposase
MPLDITRDDHSIDELRREAAGCRCSKQARRLLGLALVLEGSTREAAAKAVGMTRQTLRDWVHRYNILGVEGLRNKPISGRPPRLSEAQLRELDVIVEAGPDPDKDKVVRWRCVDLKAVVAEKFGVDLSEDRIGYLMNQRGYRRLSVRPQHPKSDVAAQEDFKKTSRAS